LMGWSFISMEAPPGGHPGLCLQVAETTEVVGWRQSCIGPTHEPSNRHSLDLHRRRGGLVRKQGVTREGTRKEDLMDTVEAHGTWETLKGGLETAWNDLRAAFGRIGE